MLFNALEYNRIVQFKQGFLYWPTSVDSCVLLVASSAEETLKSERATKNNKAFIGVDF